MHVIRKCIQVRWHRLINLKISWRPWHDFSALARTHMFGSRQTSVVGSKSFGYLHKHFSDEKGRNCFLGRTSSTHKKLEVDYNNRLIVMMSELSITDLYIIVPSLSSTFCLFALRWICFPNIRLGKRCRLFR